MGVIIRLILPRMKRFLLAAMVLACTLPCAQAQATLPSNFTVQNGMVFDEGYPIPGADAATFKSVDGRFSAGYDKAQIYASQFAVFPFDGANAVFVDGPSVPAENYYDFSGCDYLKDSKRVYSLCFSSPQLLPMADPATFQILDASYAKDAKHVYYRGEFIEGSDAASFTLLGGGYGKDANYAYFEGGKILEGANVETFRLYNNLFATDGAKVWRKGYLNSGTDAANFKAYGNTYYRIGKDVFAFEQKVTGADAATFEEMEVSESYVYGKDAKNVYILQSQIAGADPKTFQVVRGEKSELADGYFTKDKNAVYADGTKLANANPQTFKQITSYLATDGKRAYFQDSSVDIKGEPQLIEASSYTYHDGTSLFEGAVRIAIPAEFGPFDVTKLRVRAKDDGKNPPLFFSSVLDDGTSLYMITGSYGKRTLYKLPISRAMFQGINTSFFWDDKDVYYFTTDDVGNSFRVTKVAIDPALFLLPIAKEIFAGDQVIKGLDPNNARLISQQVIADNDNVWRFGEKLPGVVDVKTVQPVAYGFLKDSKNVYHIEFDNQGEQSAVIIPGADLATFQGVGSSWAADKNGIYHDEMPGDGKTKFFFAPEKNGPFEGVDYRTMASQKYLYHMAYDSLNSPIRLPIDASEGAKGFYAYGYHFYTNGATVFYVDTDAPDKDGFASIVPIVGADPATFRAFESTSLYGRDLTHTYYKADVVQDFGDTVNHKYMREISILRGLKIIDGYADNTFRPDLPINRAEFLKIVYEASQAGQLDKQICMLQQTESFKDVPADAWYASYVCLAKKAKIIQGYPDGTFRPDRNINYVEALKLIYAALNIKPDAGVGITWYDVYVNDSRQRGASLTDLTNGVASEITRGQMVRLIYMLHIYPMTPHNLD